MWQLDGVSLPWPQTSSLWSFISGARLWCLSLHAHLCHPGTARMKLGDSAKSLFLGSVRNLWQRSSTRPCHPHWCRYPETGLCTFPPSSMAPQGAKLCLLSQQMMVYSYRVEEIIFSSHPVHRLHEPELGILIRVICLQDGYRVEQHFAHMVLFVRPSLFLWSGWLEDREVRSKIVVTTEWMKSTDPRKFPQEKKDKY